MSNYKRKIVIPNFDGKLMYCPSCLSPLQQDGGFTYEDVCNSTVWSQKWVCNSKGYLDKKTGIFKQCLCNKYKTFWNDQGDFFSGEWYRHEKEIEFIGGDSCYGAINSFAKKSEITIFGNGLKRTIYLHPGLCLWFLRPIITFSYCGDEIGNVTGRKWKLQFLKKDHLFGKGSYCVYYYSGISALYRTIKHFHKDVKRYKKDPNSKFCIGQLYDHFKLLANWDRRWWRLTQKAYYNIFFCKLKKEIIKKHLENKK